ncbi:molybdopterin-biosynthesis enzyme MoeA-like protein [Natronocella acetinitrilica]|uniref:Molybdopterin-biosynthesis enzyme MoeA-like protein n=1 Tax=Natronocella acetinitrilica TaxID=414046 RepID=A0AAE3KDJ6_9GAMM|nr:molybdopterin-biosynthesis enzyme MoeA-like protein [Natronocella acetinitrilica]
MSPQSTPRFGAIIIGDEILSGKRQDKHMRTVIELLAARGLELAWARYLGDDPAILTQNLRETFAQGHVVFSFGGIGGTPDDRTRHCAAEAAGLSLEAHPEGLRLLEEQFGPEGVDRRRRMVEFPAGAELIPNPVNRVPGFSLQRHHFVPGFPNMAWPMVEWVLDALYADRHAVGSRKEETVTVIGVRESDMTPVLEDFTTRYPALRVSCLPRWCPPDYELELGLTGDVGEVDRAMSELRAELDGKGWRYRDAG